MRLLYTSALLLMALHLPAHAEAASGRSIQDEWEDSAYLSDLTAHFPGAEALPDIKKLLEKGTDPNAEDARGDTPLLLLCQSLELDYRYRTEPHYRNAVDQAIILLLQNKANALHENKNGCNAMFYLQGKPDLLKQLGAQKLLPPELSVRIPHEEVALLRYMRLRVAQADRTTNEASRTYLSRRYCAPGYERALKLLQKYNKAEMRKYIPSTAMETTLAFMRLGNAEGAEKYVNDLPVWEHGEHFLEEVPAHMLQCLDNLEWNVKPELLQTALDRLDALLPSTEAEMIDCNVAPPMCCLLTMLDRQSKTPPAKLLDRFSRSRDNRVVYTALCLRLQHKGLPCPDPESLVAALHSEQNQKPLTPVQIRILECAMVDSAIRNLDLQALDADMVRRVRDAWNEMGLHAHAALLGEMVDEEGLTIGEEGLSRLEEEYSSSPEASPQVVLARYILNHPAPFSPASGKK